MSINKTIEIFCLPKALDRDFVIQFLFKASDVSELRLVNVWRTTKFFGNKVTTQNVFLHYESTLGVSVPQVEDWKMINSGQFVALPDQSNTNLVEAEAEAVPVPPPLTWTEPTKNLKLPVGTSTATNTAKTYQNISTGFITDGGATMNVAFITKNVPVDNALTIKQHPILNATALSNVKKNDLLKVAVKLPDIITSWDFASADVPDGARYKLTQDEETKKLVITKFESKD